MTFVWALEALKEGASITRKPWQGIIFLTLVKPTTPDYT